MADLGPIKLIGVRGDIASVDVSFFWSGQRHYAKFTQDGIVQSASFRNSEVRHDILAEVWKMCSRLMSLGAF